MFGNQTFMLLKKESVFFVRRCSARTAEFWSCKAFFEVPRKYDGGGFPSFSRSRNLLLSGMEMTMTGIQAMQWAKEISKLPDGCFTIAFFPCSRHKGEASATLTVKEGCRWRTQLPEERFSIDSDNFFLFTDADGEPKMCYRILIRYMGFPQDGFKLHKIDWL